jgi:hypothetical protein
MMIVPTHSTASLSGTLAKRTTPTQNQILPKSLSVLPSPKLTQNNIALKLKITNTKNDKSRAYNTVQM